jgi:hypothetical protein
MPHVVKVVFFPLAEDNVIRVLHIICEPAPCSLQSVILLGPQNGFRRLKTHPEYLRNLSSVLEDNWDAKHDRFPDIVLEKFGMYT